MVPRRRATRIQTQRQTLKQEYNRGKATSTIFLNEIQSQGGGGTLIFSYIRRLGSFFGFKILNFIIFLGFSEKVIIFGMKNLWIFFGVITKFDLYLGVISMHFRVFS